MKTFTIISSAIALITLIGLQQNWFYLEYGQAITTILAINLFLCPISAIISSTIELNKEIKQ